MSKNHVQPALRPQPPSRASLTAWEGSQATMPLPSGRPMEILSAVDKAGDVDLTGERRQESEAPTTQAPLRLSVIMPSFNEEGSIEGAVREVQQAVFTVVPNAELIDSSKDRTPEILKALAAADPRIRVIFQPPNGHGPALRTGLDNARGEFVFLIDSDRQIPLEAFPQLWESAQVSDAAMGVRVRRHDPWLRLRLTWLVRRCVSWLFGVAVYDANVPFKIVRRSVWLQAATLIPPGALAPSLFLAVFIHAGGFKVSQAETPHRERQAGVVSIRRWKLVKVCMRGFHEMLGVRRRLRQWKQQQQAG
jgi:dolichol-phosphate mannosyltransferase